MTHPLLVVAPEVADALEARHPVVALESTIVTHGMPSPVNLETALAVENEVRAAGAVPATIAVFDGAIHVGLSPAELAWLASAPDVVKVSRRDLAFVLADGRPGGTTVAATMIGAALAGIGVFATGGIGGVHRGAGTTFDVSADLHELARTDVTVVCAGVKSILDIGATLEYLETLGVPVVGYRTDTMPAFYARESAFEVPLRIDDVASLASVLEMRRQVGISGGVVVANPIPADAALSRDEIETAIGTALRDADAAGVSGKETTPFLLARVAQLTGDRSLTANVALVRNNARLGAELAGALAR